MADEELDWDDDEGLSASPTKKDEDAVSLGDSDEGQEALEVAPEAPTIEDTPIPPPTPSPEAPEHTSNKRSSRHRGDRDRDRDRERHRDSRDRDRDRDHGGHRERERRPQKMTLAPPVMHALPPKPVTTVPAFTHHMSHGAGIEATMMALSSLKDSKDGKPKSTSTPTDGKPKSSATSNGAGTPANNKNNSTDRERDPDDWDARQASSSRNPPSPNFSRASLKESWERPSGDDRERGRRPEDRRADSDHRDRPSSHATRGLQRRDESASQHDSSTVSQDDLSYQDRHYRPSEWPASASTSAPPRNSDHNVHSSSSRALSPPPRARNGRRGARGDDPSGGSGRWSPPPPPNPNTLRSASGSMSTYPDASSDFSSKRAPSGTQGWGPDRGDRERERPNRDARDSTRGNLERERDQRSMQGHDEPRDRRGYGTSAEEGREQERRDGRDREQRGARERPDGLASHKDSSDVWPKERDGPPHQFDRKYNDFKQDSGYSGRDSPPPHDNSMIPSLHSQTQSRSREQQQHDSQPSMRHRDPPREQRSMMSAPNLLPLPTPASPSPLVAVSVNGLSVAGGGRHVQGLPQRYPRNNRRSRSRSGSPPPQQQQRKREKSRFAPAPAGEGSGSGGSSVVGAAALIANQASMEVTSVVEAFGLRSTSAVDMFVPDELLEDAKEAEKPELRKERATEQEAEVERVEERVAEPPREIHEPKVEESPNRPKRAPLPPQSQIFKGERRHGSNRSAFGPASMPPVSARFPPPSDHAPSGPRDTIPPPVERLPSGPRRSSSRGRFTGSDAMQVDTNIPSGSTNDREMQPSPQQLQALGPPPRAQAPSGLVRTGSGMYADRESSSLNAQQGSASASTDGGSVPRGPRAMATPTGPSSFGYGPNAGPNGFDGGGGFGRGRGRDRSPPHMGGYNERGPRGSEAFRGRGRGSGSNNVPIGVRPAPNAATGESHYLPAPGPPMNGFDSPFPQDNGYRGRGRPRGGGRGRGRGGPDLAPVSSRSIPQMGPQQNSYRPDNLPETEPGRYDPPPARFEREPAPHRRFTENESAPPSMPPPPSRQAPVSSSWESNDGHDRPERFSTRSEGDSASMDGRKLERDRFPPGDGPPRVRSLEDRLGAPSSSDRYTQEPRPTSHPLPLNPTLRRDIRDEYPDDPRQSSSYGQSQPFHGRQSPEVDRRDSFRPDHDSYSHSDNLVDRVGGYDNGGPSRPPKSGRRMRGDPVLDNNTAQGHDVSSSSHNRMEGVVEHSQRPSGLHRSVSLLERLGEGGADGKAGGFDEPPSLRDRVQIPSKRDWDDGSRMDSSPDRYGGREPYFEAEEESAAKKRRKNGKPRRLRKGGPA
ncbi:WW domain-containing protein [Favolaschia claudopus]|uniref:WW domain-containing protein n=1 Tax=Favolaschia claudopus TaxID=2862362 RepID=A0AAW0D7G8_9AGAR